MREDNDHGRFDGIARLYSAAGLARLRQAHVCVVGLGGVGSWTTEALARSGIGQITLIDLDEICVSNINRQLPALEDTVGMAKVAVMAARLRAINPALLVHPRQMFFTEANAEELLAQKYSYVVDAIDGSSKKSLLIAGCRARGLAVVTVGAAGGRTDPTAIRVADLARSTHDRLLVGVRNILRREHGFPKDGLPFGVDCVYSTEPIRDRPLENSSCARTELALPGKGLNCDGGYGSACHVTGAFGFAAAGLVLGKLARQDIA
jgi:tRNA threonylcarbamoyladenosine dehydratase